MYSFRQIDLFVNKVYDYHCRISNSQESTLTHGRHPYHRHMCVCLVTELCLTLCDPMDCSPQAPLFMGFSRQEYWSGLPCPPLGDLPNSGIKPASLVTPALTSEFFATEPLGKPQFLL